MVVVDLVFEGENVTVIEVESPFVPERHLRLSLFRNSVAMWVVPAASYYPGVIPRLFPRQSRES